MKPDLLGPRRQRILLAVGVGLCPQAARAAQEKDDAWKGNCPRHCPVNAKVVEYGSKSIKALLGLEAAEEAPAEAPAE